MASSLIYTAATGPSTVLVGGTVPIGTTVRRFGQSLRQSGQGVIVEGPGYYAVDAVVTLAPTVAGTVSVFLAVDGQVVPGSTSSATVASAGDSVTLPISAAVRQRCCETSTLALQLGGTISTVTSVALRVIKE